MHKAMKIALLASAWSLIMVVVHLALTHNYVAALVQLLLAVFTPYIVNKLLEAEERKHAHYVSHRIIVRVDGRRCIAALRGPWYVPAPTKCGEIAVTPVESNESPTCLACIATHEGEP